jgi:hypothetical protein
MAANPFYIEPLGGQYGNIAKGLQGLGSVLNERRQEKEAQAKTQEAQAVFSRGNPEEISQFMIANPEIGSRAAAGVQFANQMTEQNLVDSAKRVLSGENPEQVLVERIKLVTDQGGDPSDSIAALEEFRADPQGFMAGAEQLLAIRDPQGYTAWKKATGAAGGDVGTEEAQFNRLIDGLPPEQQRLAKNIKLGLDPRATGSAAQTIALTGVAGQVASSEAIIEGAKSGAKESAKLAAQYKLAPAVKSAVADAVAVSTAKAGIDKENRSNTKALDVYNTGMGALASAMTNAYTGPIVGLMPAMTADAQIADGAVAAMGPVLKQMFRSAGEGVFTDKDQELLMGMLPTRKDLPEARAAKLKNIDAIVRAKLAQEVAPIAEPTADSEAVQWAKANLNDPRSAEILRLQGGQ